MQRIVSAFSPSQVQRRIIMLITTFRDISSTWTDLTARNRGGYTRPSIHLLAIGNEITARGLSRRQTASTNYSIAGKLGLTDISKFVRLSFSSFPPLPFATLIFGNIREEYREVVEAESSSRERKMLIGYILSGYVNWAKDFNWTVLQFFFLSGYGMWYRSWSNFYLCLRICDVYGFFFSFFFFLYLWQLLLKLL